MKYALKGMIAGATLLCLCGAPAAAQDLIGESKPCQATVQAQIQKWGLAPDEISAIDYVRKWGLGHDGGAVMGVNAWIGLRSCRGELVVDMRRDCSQIQSYATGDCGHSIKQQ